MVLECYKEKGKPIWISPDGRVWNFHPLSRQKSLAGGLGAFRIASPSNQSFLSKVKEKIAVIRPEVMNIRPNIGNQLSKPVKMPIVPFGRPRKIEETLIQPDVMPQPTRGYLPNHKGANTVNDEQIKLAVEASPQQDKGVFLPSNRKFNVPAQQSQSSNSQQAQDSQQQGGNFGNDLLDRFKNGDVDITKTVTDIKTIVDAFKGNGGNSNPTPIYIPIDNGGGGSRNVNVKNDNTLLYIAGIGVVLLGGAILMKDK